MKRFSPNTIINLNCDCGQNETIKLGDLPHTPGGKFVMPITMQCGSCLRCVSCEIHEDETVSTELGE